MSAIELRKPIKIGSKTVILIPDHISSEMPEASTLLDPGNDHYESLWVSDEEVAKARSLDPTAVVHGVWQVILHNRLVPKGTTAAVIQATERSGFWVALHDDRATESGQYVSNRLPASVGSMESAFRLTEIDLGKLKLPSAHAVLPDELAAIRGREARRMLIVLASGLAAVAAFAFFADLILAARGKSVQQQITEVQAQISGLNSRTALEAQRRNSLGDEDRLRFGTALTRVMEVVDRSFVPEMLEAPLDGSDWTFKVASTAPKMSFPSTIESKPGAPVTVTFNPTNPFTPEAEAK